MSEPLLPSFRFRTEHLSDINSWHPHIPFGYDIMVALQPKLLVELGTHYGDSYFNFCQARIDNNLETICYSVDTWKGDQHSGKYDEDVFEKVKKYNNDKFSDFSYLIRSTFEEAVNQFEDNSIDLLHIDGLHTYEAVSKDFRTWLPKVKDHGIILIHDTMVKHSDFGVWKFWNEIKGEFPHFSFDHGYGLGVLQKRTGKQDIGIGGFVLNKENASAINKVYFGSYKLMQAELRQKESKRKLKELSSEKKRIEDHSLQKIEIIHAQKEKIEKELEDTIKLSDVIRAEISEKDSHLQKIIKETENANEEAENANKELMNIKKKLYTTDDELAVSHDKIKRMQDSFSWKSTKILRFLRRHTIDNHKKKNRYKELRYHIDNFKTIQLNDKIQLNIEGWVHNGLKQADIIYILIGNRIEIIEYNVTRPDLKNIHNNLSSPYLFGFTKRITMNTGFKKVQLYVKVNSRKYLLKSKIFMISDYDIKKKIKIFRSPFKKLNLIREKKLKLSYLNNLHKYEQKKEFELTVIIPVYINVLLTKRCINSVLKTIPLNQTKFQILVINDDSPEEKISSYISNLDNENIVVVNNSDNIGFVDTVNKGFFISNPNDIILLNSDTQVHGDWIDRTLQVYKENDDAGTVTPLSNNATICSFPSFPNGSELPNGIDFQKVDKLISDLKIISEIPTGVGSCMFISRKLISSIGLLDSSSFGKGYGEENDFCLRGERAGFKNYACYNVFIYHHGGASFLDNTNNLKNLAIKKISEFYPNYNKRIQQHIIDSQKNRIWFKILLRVLECFQRKTLIHITNNRGGGTFSFIKSKSSEFDAINILISPIDFNDRLYKISFIPQNIDFCYHMSLDELFLIFTKCDKSRIIIHQILDYNVKFINKLKLSNVKYILYLHDFFFKCPQISMSNPNGQYCKDPDESTCNVCLSERKSSYADNIFIWREFTLDFLNKAEQIIAPSLSTKQIYKTTFPDLQIDVCYHDDTHKLTNYTTNTIVDKHIKIAVLGSISIGKGSLRFLDFIQYTIERDLPYKFVCIGVLDCKAISVDCPNLTITGNYDENNLDNLIKTHNPNIFWFPAQSPETFSFTLSEVLRTGLPVIASDIGAFSERLRDRKNSVLIPWDASNSTISDSFQKIIRVVPQ